MKSHWLRTAVAGVVVHMTAAGAFAADLPPASISKARIAVPSPAYNWSGFYGGGNVGYGWNSQTDQITPIADPAFILFPPLGAATSVPVHAKGFIGGAQLGYNWQLS